MGINLELMAFKRPRSPNSTPNKSSDKSAKIDECFCVRCKEATVSLVIGALSGSIGPVLQSVKMTLSHLTMRMLPFSVFNACLKSQRLLHCITLTQNLM